RALRCCGARLRRAAPTRHPVVVVRVQILAAVRRPRGGRVRAHGRRAWLLYARGLWRRAGGQGRRGGCERRDLIGVVVRRGAARRAPRVVAAPCAHAHAGARGDAQRDGAEARVAAFVVRVVAQDVLLREVGGDVRERRGQIAGGLRREDCAAGRGCEFLHAPLGGQV